MGSVHKKKFNETKKSCDQIPMGWGRGGERNASPAKINYTTYNNVKYTIICIYKYQCFTFNYYKSLHLLFNDLQFICNQVSLSDKLENLTNAPKAQSIIQYSSHL